MELLVSDTLNWAKDPEILSTIKKEILYYSNKIIKVNHFGIGQERVLVLTDDALYNFQKKKLKRKIQYSDIRGVTFSPLNTEFIVHGNDMEYDFYFISPERNLIIEFMSKFYQESVNKPLKICKINEKSIKNYVTSKKEKKKDGSISRMDEKFLISIDTFRKEFCTIKEARRLSICNIQEENIENEYPEKITSKLIFSKIDSIINVSLENFETIKIIGRGLYGKVYLVLFKSTKTLYVMKSFKKEDLTNQNDLEEILYKKNILQNINNPFLIGIIFCFQTGDRVYFISNFIQGIDLGSYIRTNPTMNDSQIQLYAAIIGIVIDYLHKNGIEYIGLRTDNILIDKDGYLKISDFKMSNLFNLKQKTIIFHESSEYLAPEVIQSNLLKQEADWWIYGIMLYELIFGITPFFSDNEEKLKENILKSELKFPKKININKGAKELIKKLLVKKPNERLGHNKGFEAIKKESFFKDFDFQGLISKKINVSFKPSDDLLENKEFITDYTYEDLVNCKIINK